MPKKILIIEDEQALAENLELVLGKEFTVSLAGTGRDGLNRAKKEKPDLIYLDVMLPDLQGPEVLAALKADVATASIPVIVLTNLDNPETVSKILSAGGKEYLVKTDWSIEELLTKTKEVLQ